MPRCPFNMHDKTAWLQPHSKTFIIKNERGHTQKETAATKNYTYGYSKKPQQGLSEWTQAC